MTKYATKVNIATPQALKDIAAQSRLTGMIRYVTTIDNTNVLVTGGTLPEFTLKYVPYMFDAFSVLEEAPPLVYRPTGDTPTTPLGAYIMMRSDRFILSFARPSSPPGTDNSRYRAVLTTPDRVVTYNSPILLPTTPTLDNWVGDVTPIELEFAIATNGLPNFDADFKGQRVKDITTGLVFRALNAFDNSPPTKWVLDMPDFVKIDTTETTVGEITGDVTIREQDHLQFRQLTNSAIVTLPTGVTERIRVKLSHFDTITGGSTALTLRPAVGATINGGNTDVLTPNNNNYIVYNYGNDWLVE